MDINRTLPPPPSTFDPYFTTKQQEMSSAYYYLEDDPLSRLFIQGRDFNKEYNIALVLYKINDSLETPFLEFYFEKLDGLYGFPQKALNMNEFKTLLSSVNKISPNESTSFLGGETSNEEDESIFDDSNEIDDEFLEQCSQFLQEKTGLISNESYDGFLESADGTIYVFYDFTHLEFTKGTWAVMDEIINKHRIADTGIKDADYKLFYDNPVLIYMRRINREPIEIPVSCYLCINQDSQILKNAYHTETENSQLSISLINEKNTHPIFKRIYLFSHEPILYENLDLIKRYAVFTKDMIYFLNSGFELTPEMNIDVDDKISISFYQEGKLYFASKVAENFAEL